MILSRNVRDNVASLLGSAGHRSAGHCELASWTSLCEYIVIAPNVVDAVHGTTCRGDDVPFCLVSRSQISGSESAKEKEDMLKAVTVKTDGGNQISMSTDR